MSISFGPFCVSALCMFVYVCMYGWCVCNNYRSSFQYNCAGIIKHNGTEARNSNRTAETSVCTEKKTRLVENGVITSPSPDRALILLLCNAYLYFGHIHSRSPPHTHTQPFSSGRCSMHPKESACTCCFIKSPPFAISLNWQTLTSCRLRARSLFCYMLAVLFCCLLRHLPEQSASRKDMLQKWRRDADRQNKAIFSCIGRLCVRIFKRPYVTRARVERPF